jgi:3-oxoacyl-[acyl-carrier protein] reductase
LRTELKGKVAVVTGAAGTMGRAVVSFLKEDGLRVVGLDLKGSDIDCDIGNAEAVAAAMQGVGPVDVLVNNAGILPPTSTAPSTSRRR